MPGPVGLCILGTGCCRVQVRFALCTLTCTSVELSFADAIGDCLPRTRAYARVRRLSSSCSSTLEYARMLEYARVRSSAYSRILAHTHAYSPIPAHSHVRLLYARRLEHILAHTGGHRRIPVHTCAYHALSGTTSCSRAFPPQ